MTATLRLYDTATREKTAFAPIDPKNVRLYVCGPTVYDRAHIGNARPVIVFDLLYRLLRHHYGAAHVTYVRNITDVDDKIIARARATAAPGEDLNAAIQRVTRTTTEWFHEDAAALGALPPDHEPRATDHVAGMIAMAEGLIAAGAAYAAEGHVLFDVSAFESYGALSRRAVEDMVAGARVEVAPYKRNPMDFVLWKPSGADEPGWESPWGLGRPGWHIECSVMSKAMLGDSFDIHGGGVDLVFPHHENERAQSLCAHPGSEFAKLWMHNGFVQVEGEKMSKSLGNFVTVHDLRDQAPGPAIRLAMLTTQYRQPFDWTRSLAQEATDTLERWSAAARAGGGAETGPDDVDAAFLEALSDDLNTPKALARLHELHREAAGAESARRAFIASAALLGLDLAADPVGAFRRAQAEARGFDAGQDALIERLLTRRLAARKAKDFAAADAIRDGLAAAGVEVKDTPGGFEHALGAGFDAAALAALAAAHLGEDALE